MRVYLYSPQFELAELIAENMTAKSTLCIPFLSTTHLIDSIKNSKEKPELILLDYLSFNHELFNLREHMFENKFFAPVVFFNDPCVTNVSRVEHWKSVIKKLSYTRLTIDLNKYDPFLNKLNQFIESDEIREYIPLMTPSKKLPEKYIKDPLTIKKMKESSTEIIQAFKERVSLPNNLYYLLLILQKHKDTPLSYKEILQIYTDDNKKLSYESLQVTMSKLKNMIRKDPYCNFLIANVNKKFRFVVYK